MDQPNAKPTIQVKKADGTTVQMTLEEFRAYKAQKNRVAGAPNPIGINPNTLSGTPVVPNQIVTPHIEPIAQVAPPAPTNLPMVEQSQELATSTPTVVGEVMKHLEPVASTEPEEDSDPASTPLQQMSDNVAPLQMETNILPEKNPNFTIPKVPPAVPAQVFPSPLEDVQDDVASAPHSPVSDISETLTQEIITPIAFLVEKEVEPKLHALVLSRVKEIRTQEQVKEIALSAVDQGGLGLDEMKVNILLHAIEEAMQKKPAAAPMSSSQARLQPVVPPVATINKAELKPVTGAAAAPPQSTKPDAQKILSSLIAEDRIQAEIMKPTFTRIDTGKVQMQDVVARQTSMGPVDEMMNFSLVDFRRLGANPEASADALIQKFSLLKTDSYLLFLNGRNAWFKSPFYSGYLEILQQSLATHRPIAAVLSTEKDAFKMEEIQAIVRVSQSLNL